MNQENAVILFIPDSSGSMEYPMSGMTRLAAAMDAVKMSLGALQRLQPHCRAGLLTFNHRARVLVPITSLARCYPLLKWRAGWLRADGGTDYGPVLELAYQVLTGAERMTLPGIQQLGSFLKSLLGIPEAESGFHPVNSHDSSKKIVLFLSDGENHGGCPLYAAQQLKNLGVEIHTIGVGRDPSEVDEVLLQAMATWDPVQQRPFYRFIKDANVLVDHFVNTSKRLVIES